MYARFFCLFLALLFWGAQAHAQSTGQYQSNPTQATDGQFAPLRINQDRELLVSPGGGSATTPGSIFQKNIGVTTYTKTSVTLNGASQQLLAASNTRNAITIYNPSVNANIWVDISGGTAAAETGMLVPAGYTAIITGSVVPKTAITVIGTNAQLVSVQEGH